ncbi:MAG: type I-E CRISPR-associated protein Cse1/CasA [Candidatus Dadabacteria bacterium]|nr:MAG: type I-E CRISPR-associated protein Cse1/CasA [Candidatus Dadabacteria bacterium]
MNLLTTAWIPVRRAAGDTVRIRPSELTDPDIGAQMINAPRADFNGALAQFLIGLLQTTFAPQSESEWERFLGEPPTPEMLERAFEPWTDIFDLDGEGPRFLQDLEPFEQDVAPKPIASLLIDAPGDQTLRNNADHFVKRDTVRVMCFRCAAMALLTLQVNAPSGGKGHRTSIRGGGPLTTLVEPDPEAQTLADTLWTRTWLNVLPSTVRLTGNEKLTERHHIFPWLAETCTTGTTPLDAHPLQIYWAMPRRIRLDFRTARQGDCDICGVCAEVIDHYATKNYGIDYQGGWIHPLSPYAETVDGAKDPAPLHPQPGGIRYRHWLGVLQESSDGKKRIRPAIVVREFHRHKLPSEQFRLWAFGYDMDNMKPRCWYEMVFPLYTVPAEKRPWFAARVEELISAANEAAGATARAIRAAWFRRPADQKGDCRYLGEAFFELTEADFYASVRRLLAVDPGDDTKILHDWHSVLVENALRLFDERTVSDDIAWGDAERIARSRTNLLRQLYSRKLKNLLKLGDRKEKQTV